MIANPLGVSVGAGEKDDERCSSDELEEDALALSIHQLLEEAAANNTSLTAPWSLVLNGPEEVAYEATLISRHVLGFSCMCALFTAYGLRRAVVRSMGGDLAWSGGLADIIYFTNTLIFVALLPWMLYLRFCCEAFAERRVIRNLTFGSCFVGIISQPSLRFEYVICAGYFQMCAFVVGSGAEAVGDHMAEFNFALWTGTALTVMPLMALSAGLSFHWNALGYIAILVAFDCSPVAHDVTDNFTVIFIHSGFHFAVVLGVTYALEAVSRNSFLLNVKNVGLIRKERESTKEAQRMSASFSRTVSTIAHDMKTPLAAVKIGVDLSITLFKKEDVGEQKPFGEVEVILESMSSATQMAMTFLDGLSASAALLDRGDKVLEPTLSNVSVPEVVKSALRACRLWSTSNVRLTSSGTTTMLTV